MISKLECDVRLFVEDKFGKKCKSFERGCVVCEAYKAIETIFEYYQWQSKSEDFCEKCGCPKPLCCGQNKVSLEWLTKYCDKNMRWLANDGGEASILVRRLEQAAEKEAEEK